MSILEKIAEERIRQAILAGEFDNLEGFGAPVDNSEYFNAPPEERISWHILKNAGVLPEEVSLRKEIYALTAELKNTADPEKLRSGREQLEMLRTRLLVSLEQRKK